MEGKVFEKLVQSDPDLEAALFSMLNINSVSELCLRLLMKDEAYLFGNGSVAL
jgi:hypothetical protein